MLKGELDMRIAICDDEKDALQQTINIVNNVFYEMNIQCYIDQFTNALDLVQCKKQYDVIFLDIELKEHDKNGVWAAKMTKQKNPESIIIFTTNHEEYIDDVIEKYAFRYWSKPIDEYRLKKSMQVILDRMQVIKVEIYEGRDNIALPLCNIIYITPEGKHCKIVTIKGEYIATKSFKEIKEHLTAKDFCECHGSYYVNLNYVEKYSNTEVYLKYKSQSTYVKTALFYFQRTNVYCGRRKNMIDKIDMIIAIVLSCLVFIFYTNSTMPQRKNYIMSNISIILGYILIYAVSLYNIQYINIAVSVAVNFFLIYLCFKTNIKNAIIQSLLWWQL